MQHANSIRSRNQALAIISAAFILTACGGGSDERAATAPATVVGGSTATAGTSTPVNPIVTPPAVNPTTPVVVIPPAGSSADAELQIAGAPKTETEANESYSFVPTAADAGGDPMSFTIANRPEWLSFATATGALTGTPTDAQVGVYRNVTIQVAAGGEIETLAPFDIEVVSEGGLGVTLSWAPPTQNTDGSALTNLAGYKIRYGEASGTYTTTISVTNPGLASYFIEGLVPSTYYFVISSYNTIGTESTVSNEAVKTI